MSKSASAHLRLPPTPFTWRPNSPWCPGPAARAAAWRAKLYKDAQSWQIWSSSAWLSRRGWLLGGKRVARPPHVGGGKEGLLAEESSAPISAGDEYPEAGFLSQVTETLLILGRIRCCAGLGSPRILGTAPALTINSVYGSSRAELGSGGAIGTLTDQTRYNGSYLWDGGWGFHFLKSQRYSTRDLWMIPARRHGLM